MGSIRCAEGFSDFRGRCQIHWRRKLSTALPVAFGRRMCFILAAKFMPTKIEAKTNELCEAILEQLQSNGIRKRIDTFLGDSTARGQYESLMSKGHALQEKQHHGQTPDPAEISAFEKDRDALLKNRSRPAFSTRRKKCTTCSNPCKKPSPRRLNSDAFPWRRICRKVPAATAVAATIEKTLSVTRCGGKPAARFCLMPLAIFPASEKIGA